MKNDKVNISLEIITGEEARELLKCSERQMKTYRAAGLPYIKARPVRYEKAALMNWFARSKYIITRSDGLRSKEINATSYRRKTRY
ncbi:hypothetical protein D770_15050 [Flammeovirgaceae bacterium 311]|nr:hypothetical protein D770_15050 [Flammeovirgaceae bacterium 311]